MPCYTVTIKDSRVMTYRSTALCGLREYTQGSLQVPFPVSRKGVMSYAIVQELKYGKE